MKVAITGHTDGIGLAIAEAFEARGDEVIGLSRSTGFKLPADFDRVVDASDPCDIFVNNRHQYDDDTQLKLLYAMFNRWKGQNKHIVTIGSRAGECYILGDVNPYAVYKKAIDGACQQLFNRGDQRPKVTNIRPGYVDTNSIRHVLEPKLKTSDVADAVMYAVNAPFYVSQITLARQKIGPTR